MNAKSLAYATARMQLLPIETGKAASGANSVVSMCVCVDAGHEGMEGVKDDSKASDQRTCEERAAVSWVLSVCVCYTTSRPP